MTRSLFVTTHFGLIAFRSTHHALAAEKTLQGAKIDHIIIPTPKEISASCGLALKINLEECQQIIMLLKERGISQLFAYEMNTQPELAITKLDV